MDIKTLKKLHKIIMDDVEKYALALHDIDPRTCNLSDLRRWLRPTQNKKKTSGGFSGDATSMSTYPDLVPPTKVADLFDMQAWRWKLLLYAGGKDYALVLPEGKKIRRGLEFRRSRVRASGTEFSLDDLRTMFTVGFDELWVRIPVPRRPVKMSAEQEASRIGWVTGEYRGKPEWSSRVCIASRRVGLYVVQCRPDWFHEIDAQWATKEAPESATSAGGRKKKRKPKGEGHEVAGLTFDEEPW